MCNDIYGQYVDLHMTSGVFNRLDIYRYCNPEHLLIDGGWNGGLAERFGGRARWRFIWQVGARFEGDPGPEILALRRAVKSQLYGAAFQDTVGLSIRRGGQELEPEWLASRDRRAPVSGTIGRWFLVDHDGQRGAIINFINVPVTKGAIATIDTSRFGPVRAALAWTLDGRRLAVDGEQKGDTYNFAVPEAELSTVVLANRLAPVVSWELPAATAKGNCEALRLTLGNVSDTPVSGTASLRVPRGWDGPGVVHFGPIAAGEAASFSMPVRIGRWAASGRQDVWCDIETPNGAFSTYSLVPVNDGLVVDFRGNPGSYHVWLANLSDKPVSGSLSVNAPAPLNVEAAGRFRVPTRGEARGPVRVRGQEGLREIVEMSATVKTGWWTRREVVRAVIPALPNGDFEMDSAGDMKPDWWMCRKVRDDWAYERMHLSSDAQQGSRALLLEPPREGESFVCAYPVNSVLKPNTRYRVSVWIKTEATDGVYMRLGRHSLGKGKTGGNEWRHFMAEHETGSRVSMLYRVLFNYSAVPALFDDIVIEEM